MQAEIGNERQVVGGQQRRPRAMQAQAFKAQRGVEIEMVKMQQGKDARIGA